MHAASSSVITLSGSADSRRQACLHRNHASLRSGEVGDRSEGERLGGIRVCVYMEGEDNRIARYEDKNEKRKP